MGQNWGNGNRPRRNSTVRAQHRRRCPPRFCAQCRALGPDVKLIQDHIIGLAAGGLDVIANYQWFVSHAIPRRPKPRQPQAEPEPSPNAAQYPDATETTNHTQADSMTTKVSWRCQYNGKYTAQTAYPPVDPLSPAMHRDAIADQQLGAVCRKL